MKRASGKPRRGRSGKGGQDPQKARLRRQVDDLVARTGISPVHAWQVVRGDLTLQQVLRRMARKDRIDQLVRLHGLDRAVAAQIADGHDDLRSALQRLRRRDHLARFRDRSVLLDAAEHGWPLTVHLHGLRARTGRVAAVDRYEFELADDPDSAGSDGAGPAGARIHKLQLKFAHRADHDIAVGQAPGGRRVADPIPKPQHRHHLSDRRIFAHIDDGDDLAVTTLEGDRVVGVPVWVSRWEIGLRQDGGEVVVLRHAIAAVEVL